MSAHESCKKCGGRKHETFSDPFLNYTIKICQLCGLCEDCHDHAMED